LKTIVPFEHEADERSTNADLSNAVSEETGLPL